MFLMPGWCSIKCLVERSIWRQFICIFNVWRKNGFSAGLMLFKAEWAVLRDFNMLAFAFSEFAFHLELAWEGCLFMIFEYVCCMVWLGLKFLWFLTFWGWLWHQLNKALLDFSYAHVMFDEISQLKNKALRANWLAHLRVRETKFWQMPARR